MSAKKRRLLLRAQEERALQESILRSIGAVDIDTKRMQLEGERIMREERWLAENVTKIRVIMPVKP